jgi:hypothetical protein
MVVLKNTDLGLRLRRSFCSTVTSLSFCLFGFIYRSSCFFSPVKRIWMQLAAAAGPWLS